MHKKLSLFLGVTFITMALTTNIFAEGNLVKNNSFESVQDGIPTEWTTYSFNKDVSEFTVDSSNAYLDDKCATINSTSPNDARFIQTVPSKPNTNYKLSCYIKCENVSDSGNGAVMSVEGQVSATTALRNTNGLWEYVEMYVKTADIADSFNVTVGIGGYGAESSGKASFDNIVVEETDSIPDGALVAITGKSNQNQDNQDNQDQQNTSDEQNSSDTPNKKRSSTNNTIWIIVAISVLIIAAAMYNTFKSSPQNTEEDSEGKLEEDSDKSEDTPKASTPDENNDDSQKDE